ncbi:glycosyl transferase family 28 [Microvirga vignae]|uniref:Glycosyl transferase family 28 n=1 Tax=Microvirga vignae TaxID=1225564 RepID=A0A0H1R494_9HYPH|nr:glycosyltransferase [Microvirga vignae]KLK90035.1 glycosyl transferase family 28 [Microvirga vignae]
MRVLIVVTHLLGAGHLTRAAALARAFAQEGHETTLVSGGGPSRPTGLDGIAFVQLPPVRTIGTDFRTLLDEDGAPVHNFRLAERRILLLQALKATRPDIIVTELFPFGRRVLVDEFMTLINEARRLSPRPLILCSIRDILASPSKPERIEETQVRVLENYDAVLVHGDPQIVPLEATWPVDERIRPLIHYTGYVDENPEHIPQETRNGILVSGGSSAASLPLYRAAIAAAKEITDKPWRILIGRGVTESDFAALLDSAPAHVTVERARPDFRTLLAQADLSISQAGYNTVVDLLRSGVRSVLVPFEAGHETEQRLRAERLKVLGLAETVPEADLSPQHLTEAVRLSLSRAPLPPPRINLDGARQSVAIAESLALARPALHRPNDWSAVEQALARARDRGCPIRVWWRDDDAVADTPQLDRLLSLSRRSKAGIALAVIPHSLEASLGKRLRNEKAAFALVHGWSHANHAPEGQKKAEFGAHRPIATMAAEAEQALQRAREKLGDTLLPVFVPPWNRASPELIQHLPSSGFRALSTFNDRKATFAVEGLLQVNTHIDPIDWHGTRSLADPAFIIASLAAAIDRRIIGAADREEPIGLLTHHLVHDNLIWSFCEELMMQLGHWEVPLMRPDQAFSDRNRITTLA